MDRYELNVKLEQIKKLARQKDFAAAAKVADRINFYRIKDNRTLSLLADIYEASGNYKQAREILIEAYSRKAFGRQLAYRLVRLCIKLNRIEEAEDFYGDFVAAAPRDNSKYILQYELAAAKGEPLDKRISILETYLSEDMDEKWAFELAKLYHKQGQREKCVRQCDDIILWFSEGKYVDKAMELKMMYAPLTKQQQAKYDERWGKTEAAPVKAEDIKIKEYDANNRYNTVNIQDALKESMDVLMNEEGKSQEGSGTEAERRRQELEKTKVVFTDEVISGLLSHTVQNARVPASMYNTVPLNPMFDMDDSGQIEMSIEEPVDDQMEGQLTIGDLLDAYERREAAEAARIAGLFPVQMRKKQSAAPSKEQEKATAQPEVTTDIQPQPVQEIKTEAAESPQSVLPQEMQAGDIPQSALPQEMQTGDIPQSDLSQEMQAGDGDIPQSALPQDNISEQSAKGLLSGALEGFAEGVAQSIPTQMSEGISTGAVLEAPEEIQWDMSAAAEMEQQGISYTAEETVAEEQPSPEEQPEAVDAWWLEAIPKEDLQAGIAEAAMAENTDVQDKPEDESSSGQSADASAYDMGISPTSFGFGTESGQGAWWEEAVASVMEEDLKADRAENPVYSEQSAPEEGHQPETAEQPLAETERSIWGEPIMTGEQTSTEQTSEEAERSIWGEPITIGEQALTEQTSAEAERSIWGEPITTGEQVSTEQTSEEAERSIWGEPITTGEQTSTEQTSAEAERSIWGEPITTGEPVLTEQTSEEAEQSIWGEPITAGEQMSTEQTSEDMPAAAEHPEQNNETGEEPPAAAEGEDMFGRSGNSERAANAAVKELIKEFVSKYSGVQGLDRQLLKVLQESLVNDNSHIIVMGEVKSGKTALAIDLVKVINKIRQTRGRKIAKINGEVLNSKNVTDYFERLADMDIIIERAAVMSSDTMRQMVAEIDKETVGRIIILEDETNNIESLLASNDRMKAIFNSKIVVKQNKIRDWAVVAKEYAKQQGYEIDEMGVLALHAKIDELYAISLVISRNQVEDVIDKAIAQSKKRGLGRLFKIFGKEKEKVLKEEDF